MWGMVSGQSGGGSQHHFSTACRGQRERSSITGHCVAYNALTDDYPDTVTVLGDLSHPSIVSTPPITLPIISPIIFF